MTPDKVALKEALDDLRNLQKTPWFDDSLDRFIAELNHTHLQMWETMMRKGEDYSGNSHQYTSFERNAETVFIPVEHVFLALIGVKIARLRSLSEQSKAPNHESVRDSWLDLANYIVLYIAYMAWKESNEIRPDLPNPAS